MFRNICINYLAIIILLSSGWAQSLPQNLSLNDDFVEYQKMTDEEKSRVSYIPVPFSYRATLPDNFQFRDDLPTRFDLRDEEYLTSVKDQSTANTCWAFSTMAAIESSWLRMGLGEFDLSENNLKNRHGYLRHPNNDGGNFAMASSYLSAFLGPVLEFEDPYDPFSTSSPTNIPPTAIVSEGWFTPTLEEFPDLETVMNVTKQVIYETGAIYCPLHFDLSYYNFGDNTYFCNVDAERNHAILLVGWDDNKTTDASQPGAWIARNTYGTSFGEDGYFYISYYDNQILTSDAATWPGRREYDANSYLYRHDDLGGIAASGWDNHDFGLVKFEAANNLPITHIMTWAFIGNMTISIYVYDEFESGNLSGLLSKSENNFIEYSGYSLFELPEPVQVSVNNDFYVKVEYSHASYRQLISNEFYLEDYCDPNIKSDLYWISSDGVNWNKIGSGTDFEANLAIRAYASEPGAPPVITTNQNELRFEVLPNTSETAFLTISNENNSGGRSLLWQIADEETTLQLINDNLNLAVSTPALDYKSPKMEISGSPIKLDVENIISSPLENDVSLVLDDGALDYLLGLTNGGQIVWLNRFTPNQDKIPFELNEVWVLLYETGGVDIGDLIDIYIYEDKDGDNDPGTNLNLIGSFKNAPVQAVDGYTFSQYSIDPITINEECDIVIAVVNRTAGTAAGDYPATLDKTTTHQRSWLGAYYGNPPDPPTFPADGLWSLIDDLGQPGNWLIRGYGTTGAAVPDCEWLSEFPQNGTIECGSDQIVEVTVDAAGMNLGTYQANLIVESNDPANPTLTIPIRMEIVSVLSTEEENLPSHFYLSQNYPNPFNPSTTIKFNIPTVETGHASSLQTNLIVYDILGREVKTLLSKQLQPGEYEVEFDASILSSGIYFYRLTANEFVQTRKMLLLR